MANQELLCLNVVALHLPRVQIYSWKSFLRYQEELSLQKNTFKLRILKIKDWIWLQVLTLLKIERVTLQLITEYTMLCDKLFQGQGFHDRFVDFCTSCYYKLLLDVDYACSLPGKQLLCRNAVMSCVSVDYGFVALVQSQSTTWEQALDHPCTALASRFNLPMLSSSLVKEFHL